MISPSLLQVVKVFQYLPYDTITTTNHKMYILYLDIKGLFNHSPDNATALSTRILKTSLPKRQKRYLSKVVKNFKKQNLFVAAQNLQRKANQQGYWDYNLQITYDNIDQKATHTMLAAEDQCTPKFPALYSWSTELRDTGLKLTYYKRFKRSKEGKGISETTLQRLAQIAKLHHSQTDNNDIIKEIKDLTSQLKNLKKQHTIVREKFVQQL